jgi:diguanylate cyclase (GGDEF)-like protein/PAS domain S-box-containing protein
MFGAGHQQTTIEVYISQNPALQRDVMGEAMGKAQKRIRSSSDLLAVTRMAEIPVSTSPSAEGALRAITSISDGVITVDLNKQVTFINHAAELLTGWRYEEAVGRPGDEIFKLRNSVTRESEWNPINPAMEDDERYSVLPNTVLVRRDGVEIPIEDSTSPIHDEAGHVSGAAIIFRDMTVARLMLMKALHRAHHDPLTALPNRSLLEEHLKQALAALDDRQTTVAVLFIDLDGFKEVNDVFGHAAGDHVLKAIARRMLDCTRRSDTICRIGGDEFVILMPDVSDSAGVVRVADKLLDSIRTPIPFDEVVLQVSVSIGIASSDKPKARDASLIEDADSAMYHAKQAGGNRAEWFLTSMSTRNPKRRFLEHEFHRALQNKEFVLHYQPQIDLLTGRIVGAEALLRWNSPTHGFLLPPSFIPEAEQNGLIVPIGQVVLREAVRQYNEWRSYGLPSLTMSVNVSSVELHQDAHLRSVELILLEESYVHNSVMLELTESVLLQTEKEKGVVDHLKKRGLLIGIDDFGVGYANLDYLRRFPTDAIKIDRSFVANITTSNQDVALMKAIVSMARSFDQTLIAEGVETKEQRDLLVALGCDQAQGFFFSPPIPAASFVELLLSAEAQSSIGPADDHENSRTYSGDLPLS